MSEARSRPDLVERPRLRAGEPEGEGGRDLRRDPAVAGVAAPRQPPHPAAHEGERELRGQKLVIGEAPPGRARGGGLGRDVGGGSRAMKLVQRLAEGGEAALFEKGPVLPFGQRRHAPERRADELADEPRREPLGQPVHRLDRRQLADAALVEDAVRVDHLAVAVPDLDLARDVAHRSDRQERLDALRMGVEEDEQDVAGVVLDEDAERRLAAPRRPRPVLGHPDLQRHRLADRRLGNRAFQLARDAAMRQVEQEVDDPRRPSGLADEPVEQLLDLRPDAGQRRRRREQRVEDRRAEGQV